MGEFELSATAQQWVNVILIWIGFGLLAGLLAKAVVPGRAPIGPIATLAIGLTGSAIGLGLLSHFTASGAGLSGFNPISPLGFLAATGGAFILLLGYRALSGSFLRKQEESQSDY